jgi:hypothetical protein
MIVWEARVVFYPPKDGLLVDAPSLISIHPG